MKKIILIVWMLIVTSITPNEINIRNLTGSSVAIMKMGGMRILEGSMKLYHRIDLTQLNDTGSVSYN